MRTYSFLADKKIAWPISTVADRATKKSLVEAGAICRNVNTNTILNVLSRRTIKNYWSATAVTLKIESVDTGRTEAGSGVEVAAENRNVNA